MQYLRWRSKSVVPLRGILMASPNICKCLGQQGMLAELVVIHWCIPGTCQDKANFHEEIGFMTQDVSLSKTVYVYIPVSVLKDIPM